MTKRLRSFEELSKVISSDELKQYYVIENHLLVETMAHFNIEDTELDYLLKGYQLNGLKKILYSSEEHFNKIMQTASYEEVYKYFITDLHTIDESAVHFNLSRATFRRLLAKYNIKKSTIDATATQKRFIFDTYGVDNTFQLPEIKDKIKATLLERYGVEHALQNKDFLNKAIDTSIERYGENFRLASSNDSGPNRLVEAKLKDLNIDFIREFRVGTQFFDFKVGDYLLEINPTATHNSFWSPYGDHISKVDVNYHLNKRRLGNSNKYHVISIFDWMDLDKVLNLFFKQKIKLYARQCDVKVICKTDFAKYGIKDFLNTYHLQGYPRLGQEHAVCLFYNNKLVSVQTWGKPRYNNAYKFELYRQATDLDYCVVGGNEKMFAAFQKTVNTENDKLISYCDYNLFLGNTYNKLGFTLLKEPKPTKHWVYFGNKVDNMTDKQKHFTDNLVRSNGFDRLVGNLFGTFGKGTSNDDLLHHFGYVEIYDCGQATYIWNK